MHDISSSFLFPIKVKTCLPAGGGLYIIQMEDIEAPPLLDFYHPQLQVRLYVLHICVVVILYSYIIRYVCTGMITVATHTFIYVYMYPMMSRNQLLFFLYIILPPRSRNQLLFFLYIILPPPDIYYIYYI